MKKYNKTRAIERARFRFTAKCLAQAAINYELQHDRIGFPNDLQKPILHYKFVTKIN